MPTKQIDRCSKIEGWGMIYALYDPRSPALPKYIGQTITRLCARLRSHRRDIKKFPNKPLQLWLSELKALKIKPLVCKIEEIPCEELDDRERYWLLHYWPVGCLLNLSIGITSEGISRKMSPERKAKAQPFLRKMREMNCIPVVNDKGEFFESKRAAVKSLGMAGEVGLRNALRTGVQFKGFFWKYAEKKPLNSN